MSSSDIKHQSAAVAGFNPLRMLGGWGIKSNHLCTAGVLSVVFTFIAWLTSRGKNDSRPQSDRWGLFVGEWAPTFFAMGVALKLEEERK